MAEDFTGSRLTHRTAIADVDRYEFLKAHHCNEGGLFTGYRVTATDGAVLGLQAGLPGSSTRNNLLPRDVEGLRGAIDVTELLLSTPESVPAVYFPDGNQAEAILAYLVARGYDPEPAWTDAWMFADPIRVWAAIKKYKSELPATITVRAGTATKRDWFKIMGTLIESRASPPSRNNPYGELSTEEQGPLGDFIWRLLEDDSRGQCFMVERHTLPGMRSWTKVAAVATVSYIENASFGRIAQIENVVRRPGPYRRLGKVVLLAAAEAGLKFLASDAHPFVGPARVVSLATAPDQGPEGIFYDSGFDLGFLAHGHTKGSYV